MLLLLQIIRVLLLLLRDNYRCLLLLDSHCGREVTRERAAREIEVKVVCDYVCPAGIIVVVRE